MNPRPSSSTSTHQGTGLVRHVTKRKASALMLMIWAIMLMAFTVGGVIQYMQGSLKQNSDSANQYRAAYMAECGIGLAMNPNVWVMDAVKGPDGRLVTYIRGKEQKPPGDAGFSLNKVREGSRLPINFITDKRAYEAVYNLFLLWGINNDEATTAMDCLADWVDGDKEARPQGAEADYYQGLQQNGFPRNQGFTSLDEMLLVKGFDVVARAKPDWRNYFSLYGEGTIDLFWASKDVIMAVTGAADADATRLITARAGNDGVDGTDDDNRSIGITGAISMLGIPADRIPFVQALTTYASDKVFRIVSMGYVGTHSVTITVVAKMQDDGSLTYLARSEE